VYLVYIAAYIVSVDRLEETKLAGKTIIEREERHRQRVVVVQSKFCWCSYYW
jgi:hypothetical protein